MKTPRGKFREPVTVQGNAVDTRLTLKRASGQTGYLLRVEDTAGELLLDIDELGKLDTKVFVVQDPPDTGTAGQPTTSVHPYGLFTASDDNQNDVFRVLTASVPITQRLRVRGGRGGLMEFSPVDANDIPITLIGAVSGNGDLIEVWDNAFNNLLFRLMTTGAPVIAQHSAPADGDLAAGDMALWFDQTNGAAKFKIKAKQADGTVRTGEVALA